MFLHRLFSFFNCEEQLENVVDKWNECEDKKKSFSNSLWEVLFSLWRIGLIVGSYQLIKLDQLGTEKTKMEEFVLTRQVQS